MVKSLRAEGQPISQLIHTVRYREYLVEYLMSFQKPKMCVIQENNKGYLRNSSGHGCGNINTDFVQSIFLKTLN